MRIAKWFESRSISCLSSVIVRVRVVCWWLTFWLPEWYVVLQIQMKYLHQMIRWYLCLWSSDEDSDFTWLRLKMTTTLSLSLDYNNVLIDCSSVPSHTPFCFQSQAARSRRATLNVEHDEQMEGIEVSEHKWSLWVLFKHILIRANCRFIVLLFSVLFCFCWKCSKKCNNKNADALMSLC